MEKASNGRACLFSLFNKPVVRAVPAVVAAAAKGIDTALPAAVAAVSTKAVGAVFNKPLVANKPAVGKAAIPPIKAALRRLWLRLSSGSAINLIVIFV